MTGGTDANPLLDTSNHTAEMVDAWHKAKGWDGIGYNWFIEKDGKTYAVVCELFPEEKHATFHGTYQQLASGYEDLRPLIKFLDENGWIYTLD